MDGSHRKEVMKGALKRRAFVIVDMLEDFVREGAPLEVPGARAIVKNIKRELERARAEGLPVIYVCDRHLSDDPEFKVWPPHAVEGTAGAEVIDELKPQEGERMIFKTTYSGFCHTDMEQILREMGVEELVITGVATEICVLFTAADAYMRGFEVKVLEDCVAGITPEGHRFALQHMKEILKPRK